MQSGVHALLFVVSLADVIVLCALCEFHLMHGAVGSTTQPNRGRCRIPITRNRGLHLHQALDHVVLQTHMDEGKGLVVFENQG